MYKTKCNKCGKTYDTDVKYCDYSYVCDECKQKKKEYDSHQKDRDMAMLEHCRQEMERIKATGNQEEIELATKYYNQVLALYRSKYSDI